LKSNNKELRTKMRSISQEKKEENAAAQCTDTPASDDSQEVLFVTSAVKRQVQSQSKRFEEELASL